MITLKIPQTTPISPADKSSHRPSKPVNSCTEGLFHLLAKRLGLASKLLLLYTQYHPSTVFGNSPMKEILQYLKKYGDRLDKEIALATGTTVANVRLQISELASKGEVMTCHSIRFEKGKKVEGIRCRLSGYIPPAAPGRKSKAQIKSA